MKKLIFIFILISATSAMMAQQDSLEFKLIESDLWSTTSSVVAKIKMAPAMNYVLCAPGGQELKISDAGHVYLDDKLIGQDPDLVAWARDFFAWISCADFSKCYFQIKP